MCQHGLITKKGRSLYVNAFTARNTCSRLW